jgi:hypothetical protein
MNDIRGIRGIDPTDLSQAKIRRVEKPAQPDPIHDKVEISGAAAKIAEVAKFTEIAKAAPDIRIDLVQQAQERVADGTYLKPEVTQEVAQKILEAL